MKVAELLAVDIEHALDLIAEGVRKRLDTRHEDDLVSAKTSGIPVRSFRAAARAGAFPVFKVGREWLAKRVDVRAYVERCRVDFSKRVQADPLDAAIASGRLRRVGGAGPRRSSRPGHGSRR
jgi:hypothetical protein